MLLLFVVIAAGWVGRRANNNINKTKRNNNNGIPTGIIRLICCYVYVCRLVFLLAVSTLLFLLVFVVGADVFQARGVGFFFFGVATPTFTSQDSLFKGLHYHVHVLADLDSFLDRFGLGRAASKDVNE